MSHPFHLPKGKELLKRVAHLFTESEKAFVLRDSKIVFVCGGKAADEFGVPVSMRKRFLDYSNTELRDLRIFLAETAEQDYITHDEPEFHNIAKFEEIIAEISDCTVIFPESPGSFAELGFFSKNEQILKNILVAPNRALQGEDSFIHRGPIALIDEKSKFRFAIQIEYIDSEHESNEHRLALVKQGFDQIKHRIENRINIGKNRKRFIFSDYVKLTYREKLFVICEILKIFSALSFDGVVFAFKRIFTNANLSEIKRLLSILVAAGLVRRIDGYVQYFYFELKHSSFIQFDDFNLDEFRLEVLDFYNGEFPEVATLIREAAHAS